jgi:hypothetical protein
MATQLEVKKDEVQNQKEIILELEKLPFGFRIRFNGEERSWLVRPHARKPTLFVVHDEKNNTTVETKVIPYLDVNVSSICLLFMLTALDPEPTVEAITGEKVRVKEVHIIDYTNDHRPGFENCSIYDEIKRPDRWVDVE